MMSVTKPGVRRRAPAITRQKPSKTSPRGTLPSASCCWARARTANPCRRNIHVPIIAVKIIRPSVGQRPSQLPIWMSTAISIIGIATNAISKILPIGSRAEVCFSVRAIISLLRIKAYLALATPAVNIRQLARSCNLWLQRSRNV